MSPFLDHPRMTWLDEGGDRLAERLRGHPVADHLMFTLSHLGDMSLLWHVAGVVGGLRRGGDLSYAIRLSSIQGIEAAVVNGPVKSMFRRDRPPVRPDLRQVRRPRTSSFPSGHASAAGCAVVMLWQDAGALERLWWLALGSATAASRIHVGVHHTTDVVAGALIGVGIGAAARRWWPLR